MNETFIFWAGYVPVNVGSGFTSHVGKNQAHLYGLLTNFGAGIGYGHFVKTLYRNANAGIPGIGFGLFEHSQYPTYFAEERKGTGWFTSPSRTLS